MINNVYKLPFWCDRVGGRGVKITQICVMSFFILATLPFILKVNYGQCPLFIVRFYILYKFVEWAPSFIVRTGLVAAV
jgi:hypothetical protein